MLALPAEKSLAGPKEDCASGLVERAAVGLPDVRRGKLILALTVQVEERRIAVWLIVPWEPALEASRLRVLVEDDHPFFSRERILKTCWAEDEVPGRLKPADPAVRPGIEDIRFAVAVERDERSPWRGDLHMGHVLELRHAVHDLRVV